MKPLPPITLLDPSATRRLGQALGRLAQKGDVLWLSGGLGAGKTSLAQGLGEGLEVPEGLTSPTFGLLHEHQGRLRLAHADLYRVNAAEVVAAGLEEAWLAPRGVAIVEWPEQLGGDPDLEPEAFLWLRFEHQGEGRVLQAEALGPRAATWWREALADVVGD